MREGSDLRDCIDADSGDGPQPETIQIPCRAPSGNFQTRTPRSTLVPPLRRLSVPLSGPLGGTAKPVLKPQACVTQQTELSRHRLRVAVSVGHDGRRRGEQVIGSHLDARISPAPFRHINKKGLQVVQVDLGASPLIWDTTAWMASCRLSIPSASAVPTICLNLLNMLTGERSAGSGKTLHPHG